MGVSITSLPSFHIFKNHCFHSILNSYIRWFIKNLTYYCHLSRYICMYFFTFVCAKFAPYLRLSFFYSSSFCVLIALINSHDATVTFIIFMYGPIYHDKYGPLHKLFQLLSSCINNVHDCKLVNILHCLLVNWCKYTLLYYYYNGQMTETTQPAEFPSLHTSFSPLCPRLPLPWLSRTLLKVRHSPSVGITAFSTVKVLTWFPR